MVRHLSLTPVESALTKKPRVGSGPIPRGQSLLAPSLLLYIATSLLQIFTQLHSFEYGTRLIRYPDFTPVTT
jgi:hypothetical protein